MNFFFFNRKSECECDKIYKVGEEVWGYFDKSFETSGGSHRCRKNRFEKFRVARSEATLVDGKELIYAKDK